MIALPDSEKPALIGPGLTLSFRDLTERIRHRSQALRSPAPPEVSLLPSAPTPEFVIEVLAHLEARVSVALASPEWTEAERTEREKLLARLHPRTAMVLFTSGSTGVPKAVQLSMENIEENLAAVRATLDFSRAPEQTLFLPLHYSFGLLGQLLPALQEGIPTRLIPRLIDLTDVIASGELRGMLSGVPTHWRTILRMTESSPPALLRNVTHCVSAGGHLPCETRAALTARFPEAKVYSNYGQTELSPRALSFSSVDPRFLQEGTGFPVGKFEARLSDTGELLLRGPQVMLGYAGADLPAGDGWWHTGDLATIAPDGLVSIQGRLDDLFKVAGERVSRIEIESALRKLPGVLEAAILLEPDPAYETRVTAFVEVGASSEVQAPALRAALREHLAASKLPHALIPVAKLPRTTSGKVSLPDLKALKSAHERTKK